MTNPCEAELIAVRSRFCCLVARWRLTQAELTSLLGAKSSTFAQSWILPDSLDDNGEHRLRLLLRLDDVLQQLEPDEDIGIRLRDRSGQTDGRSPLEAFGDLRELRGAIAYLERIAQVLSR